MEKIIKTKYFIVLTLLLVVMLILSSKLYMDNHRITEEINASIDTYIADVADKLPYDYSTEFVTGVSKFSAYSYLSKNNDIVLLGETLYDFADENQYNKLTASDKLYIAETLDILRGESEDSHNITLELVQFIKEKLYT